MDDNSAIEVTPKARTENLIVSNVGDDVLVYDRSRDRAHNLNQTAALVWRNCDGQATVPQLVTRLASAGNTGVTSDVVLLAVDRLGKAGLLMERSDTGFSRRALLRKAGTSIIAGAIVLPLVTSIVAPKALAAASMCIDRSCQANKDCCGGNPTCSGNAGTKTCH
jgi:hypothetical protein